MFVIDASGDIERLTVHLSRVQHNLLFHVTVEIEPLCILIEAVGNLVPESM